MEEAKEAQEGFWVDELI